jgi:hypothetical protein
MNDERINVAIAEASGWIWDLRGKETYWLCKSKPFLAFPKPPDYVNDLNAIQEPVRALNPIQRSDYFRMLEEVVDQAAGRVVAFAVGDATARQRAEAFLRTIGK